MQCYHCQAAVTKTARHCQQCGALIRWREWSVIRELGAGGMGTAYLVEQAGQQAVLKLFHPSTTQHECMLEARNLYNCAALGVTPNPIETHTDNVVMQYLAPTKTIPIQQRIVSLLRNINILHNRGFVIVDLKPDNLIVTATGTMIIDLGSLIDILRDRPTDLAATPGYAAPELYRGQIAPIADAYGAGWCLIAFLNGPVPDPTTVGPPPSWTAPPEWEPIIRSMLEPTPTRRLSVGMAFHMLVKEKLPGADLVTTQDWRHVLPDAPHRDHHGYTVEITATDIQRYLTATGTRLPTLAEITALATGTERQTATRDWTTTLQHGLISDCGARNCRRWLWQPTADAGLFGGTAYADAETIADIGQANAMVGLRVVQ